MSNNIKQTYVMGTAGHIDHGKSELVRAMTGIDPDRLREEKERGMTIDLGFAWLKLPSGRELGIVDVPGHERFIANMLAGVGGIDLTMLVVAANESVMPQTREHVAILDLLEIKNGIVAITKKDLVDEELLTLVKMEIEELLEPTTLAGSPMVAVSSVTLEGIPELTKAIDSLLNSVLPRQDTGRPRLPIDRVFTIAGSGTVVTGTLIDGSLTVGQEVEIIPPALKSRLRGLQTHKTKADNARPGSRVAANLVGVSIDEIKRGDVVTKSGWLKPVNMLSARLRLLPDVRHSLKHSIAVSFYTGAAEVLAKVRLLEGDELKPGESTWAQFMLDKPIAAVSGDHYIIRSTTETIGGGKIIETGGVRLRRMRPAVIERLKTREEGTPEDKIYAMVEARQPVEAAVLRAPGGFAEGEAKAFIETLLKEDRLVTIGEAPLLMTRPGWDSLVQRAAAIVKEYHQKYPLRTGMGREELHSRLKPGAQGTIILKRLVEDKVLIEEGAEVRLPTHEVKFTPTQQTAADNFLKALAQNPYAPVAELPDADILNLLIQRGQVVKVSADVVYLAAVYNDMVAKVRARLKEQGKITLGEVRDMFQTSRKYSQALMEHLDSRKITRRMGDERVLIG